MKTKARTKTEAKAKREIQFITIGDLRFARPGESDVCIMVRVVDLGDYKVHDWRHEVLVTFDAGNATYQVWFNPQEAFALSTLVAGAVRKTKPGARFPRRKR